MIFQRFICTAVVSFALVACGYSAVQVTAQEAGRTIRLRPGETLAVKLPSNRTTGYSWSPGDLKSSVLTSLGPSEYRQNRTAPNMVGAGGIEIWRFKAIRAGNQRLEFVYRRLWEKGVPPARSLSFQIAVR